MKSIKYKVTIALLLVNMLFWIRLLAEYISRFALDGELIYILIAALLFLDMVAYGVLAFGLRREIKFLKILLVPFLVVNAILSITDDIGFWDMAVLILNLGTILAFFLERKKIK